jgi:hypothetical protein
MRVKRYVIVSAVVVAAAAGSAGAVAATRGDDAKKAEQSVIDDAAKRLNVSPEDLRGALAAAQDAQIDQAVKDGRLTQAQADAIKARRKQEGRVLGVPGGPGGPDGHHGPGRGFGRHGGVGGHEAFGAAATALDLTEAQLVAKLRAGKSIADVAKDQNKDLAGVKAAVKKAITDELDADVKAGRLTGAQRDDILAGIDARIDALTTRSFDGRGPGGPGGPGGHRHWR